MLKDFLPETGREEVRRALGEASVVATSRISYVECRSAVARARRERRVTAGGERALIEALDHRWTELALIEIDENLVRTAGRLVHEHPLRSADAIHLASGLAIDADLGETTFACWDRRLWTAAAAFGFTMLPEGAP